LISHAAHVILPHHISLDVQHGTKLGTTCRGVGPCYATKMARTNAVRMGELLVKLKEEKDYANSLLHDDNLWDKYNEAAEFLKPFIIDSGKYLRKALKCKQNLLFEGAQGIHLDIDHGTFPYVTSSGVGPAAIPQACGLPNLHLDRIVGVIKCYTTRVGKGPFPSEITDDIGNDIRKKGNEFGTTTGRPRRIGWLDESMTKLSIELTGATEIALTHADTMSNFDPVRVFRGSLTTFDDYPGWTGIDDKNFINFRNMLSEHLGVPITMVSYGPNRHNIQFAPSEDR